MIPITVIGGYLGAGKTTLINRMLACSSDPIGVLVNDFGELNIDAELIDNRNDMTLELTNGCVCCQISDDMGEALESVKSREIGRVIVEASGVALPAKVADYGRNWPGFMLQGVFTLVDSRNIDRLLNDKYVKHLVKDQIQQADRVLLTRTGDKRVPESIDALAKGVFDLDGCTRLPRFLMDLCEASPAGNSSTEPHAEFASTTYRSETPVSKQTIEAFIKRHPQIQRAKGWLMDQDGDCWLLQMTLSDCRFTSASLREKSEIVFVYTGSDPLDMDSLY